jgi:formate hydrogenlyase subunit 3/multisubunit Na+/H+ antiporter MnhD subunit
MGPLFSGILLLMVASTVLVISFCAAKLFLSWRSAVIAAALFTAFSGLGTLAGLFGQAIWLPPTLQGDQVDWYLGISLVSGLLSGLGAVAIFVARRRSR